MNPTVGTKHATSLASWSGRISPLHARHIQRTIHFQRGSRQKRDIKSRGFRRIRRWFCGAVEMRTFSPGIHGVFEIACARGNHGVADTGWKFSRAFVPSWIHRVRTGLRARGLVRSNSIPTMLRAEIVTSGMRRRKLRGSVQSLHGL